MIETRAMIDVTTLLKTITDTQGKTHTLLLDVMTIEETLILKIDEN